MQYDFKIVAEIAHIKLISKALDILKFVIKGELTRIIPLLEENKTSYTATKLDYPEFIDLRLKTLKSNLLSIEKDLFDDTVLNILQLGTYGHELIVIKKRFIDTGHIVKIKKLNKINIPVTQNQLQIINDACELYWKILSGHLDILAKFDKHKLDSRLLTEQLLDLSSLATGFEDKFARLEITSPSINRKAKWAYDICKSIDYIDKDDIIKNVGTLPRLKITKNG